MNEYHYCFKCTSEKELRKVLIFLNKKGYTSSFYKNFDKVLDAYTKIFYNYNKVLIIYGKKTYYGKGITYSNLSYFERLHINLNILSNMIDLEIE